MKPYETPFVEHRLDLHWFSLYAADPLLENKKYETHVK